MCSWSQDPLVRSCCSLGVRKRKRNPRRCPLLAQEGTLACLTVSEHCFRCLWMQPGLQSNKGGVIYTLENTNSSPASTRQTKFPPLPIPTYTDCQSCLLPLLCCPEPALSLSPRCCQCRWSQEPRFSLLLGGSKFLDHPGRSCGECEPQHSSPVTKIPHVAQLERWQRS